MRGLVTSSKWRSHAHRRMACGSFQSVFTKGCLALGGIRTVATPSSSAVTILRPFGLHLWIKDCRGNTYATLAEKETQIPKKELEYSNILLKVDGQDEGVLDNYCQFVKASSHVLGLDTTKQFHLPTETYKQVLANLPDSYKKHKVRYLLKKYSRMMQIKKLPVEQADIWIHYIQKNLPEGVEVHIEQKTWQDYVCPPDPRIEEQRQLDILRKKGVFNKEKKS